MDNPQNIPTIDRGRSILNATDEKANPYGLILSVKEREFIYGALNRIDHRADAILNGKKGWKQQAEAAFYAGMEVGLVSLLALGLRYFFGISYGPALVVGLVFLVLQKVNLLLTHEKTDDTLARQEQEARKEAKERVG